MILNPYRRIRELEAELAWFQNRCLEIRKLQARAAGIDARPLMEEEVFYWVSRMDEMDPPKRVGASHINEMRPS